MMQMIDDGDDDDDDDDNDDDDDDDEEEEEEEEEEEDMVGVCGINPCEHKTPPSHPPSQAPDSFFHCLTPPPNSGRINSTGNLTP